jgi:RimJ/RimL family protein N-acetyltransferase
MEYTFVDFENIAPLTVAGLTPNQTIFRERRKMILETKRFALRQMVESDLDFQASMLGNPEVMLHYPKPLGRDEAKGWLQRTLDCYARAGHGFWIVERRKNWVGRESGRRCTWGFSMTCMKIGAKGNNL